MIVVLGIACALLLLIVVSAYNRADKLKKEKVKTETDNAFLREKNDSLSQENDLLRRKNEELSVYENALDADKEAKERLEKAKTDADNIINGANFKAETLLKKAEKDAEDVLSAANKELQDVTGQTSAIKKENRQLIQKAKEDAEKLRDDASRQSSYILAEAERKAKEIAGEAYEIANKAKHYEEVAKAMKNVIEGYGDEYLKPTYSLLDDLAGEFGYDEAGQKLKDARERTRLLIKNNDAASCDYVEQNRKETAINFVLDAFNGKVDTILSMIKKDNYGILEQKIRDAYSLVNNLGSAFRNARINPVYLDSRLDELKWGATVNELKLQEREEQRRIKEQIREEEKARREYEKAMRDAAKEEEMIRKAMEKAQQAILKANEEQKAKFEAQLADLQQKLVEAEEKNKKALSMAQQTKSGHVYIISNIGSFGENVYKIGMTRRLEPLDRVRELGDASVPFPFDVHAMIYSENAPALETELHHFFVQNQVNKVNPRKEFFRVPISEIREEIEKRHIDVKWTMAADAAEYRETLAIEKSMAESQNSKDEWIKQQERFKDEVLDDEE